MFSDILKIKLAYSLEVLQKHEKFRFGIRPKIENKTRGKVFIAESLHTILGMRECFSQQTNFLA